MSRKKIRTGKPQTIQDLSMRVQHAFGLVDNDRRRTLVAIDNVYRRTRIAAYYPWPFSAILFWLEDHRARVAQEKQMAMEAKAQAEAQAAIDAEPIPKNNVVTMDKSIVGPDGNPLGSE
jgi:hypothetical protein